MENNFISRKDRIIASAIEIISESGLSSLSTKMLAMKENMSESLLYRYFGGIDEVLVEVVAVYTKFDENIFATVEAKNKLHIEKIKDYLMMFVVYFDNYKEISAICLNYEGLLHNVNTREAIAACIQDRNNFLIKHFKCAIEEGEIIDTFTPQELAGMFFGTLNRELLNRRLVYHKANNKKLAGMLIDKMLDLLKVKPKEDL